MTTEDNKEFKKLKWLLQQRSAIIHVGHIVQSSKETFHLTDMVFTEGHGHQGLKFEICVIIMQKRSKKFT